MRRAPAPDPRVTQYWLLFARVIARQWLVVLTAAGGLLTMALLAATRPTVKDGRDRLTAASAGTRSSPVRGHEILLGTGAAARSRPGACRPGAGTSGYVNPLAGARLTPKRIDQGVDYAGSGTLTAIGTAQVTEIATEDTGWPGAFIEYELLDGPEAGCQVFYAEGITPAVGLTVGETIRAGQPVATIIPGTSSGIEIGWGSGNGTETYAAEQEQWSARNEEDNIPTPAGESFSALIAALGGLPGRVEG